MPVSRVLILSRRFKTYSPHGGGSGEEKPAVVTSTTGDNALLKKAGLVASTGKSPSPEHCFLSVADVKAQLCTDIARRLTPTTTDDTAVSAEPSASS